MVIDLEVSSAERLKSFSVLVLSRWIFLLPTTK